MKNSHMKRILGWCILLLTAAAFFPLGLSAQEQTQTVKQETGFYYTVKKGDTLWDISKKFFDDPWLWPDLWEKNSQLPNPHWIYPGDLLRLYLRNGKLYIEKAVSAEPPPAPPSEPAEPPYFLYSSMEQVGFIPKPPVSPSGIIFKIQGEGQMATVGDTVYIRTEGSAAMPVGSRFTIFRLLGIVKDPANKNQAIGTQHYLTGVAEVTRQEDGYVMANIIRNFRAIDINDQVMPYEPFSFKIYLAENPASISGTVLQSEDQTNLIGENTIAFIDKGEQDGVTVGQRFRVYNQEEVKLNPKDKLATRLPPVDVGTILVLHTERNSSTVLVISSNAEFGPGTKFRPINAD